MNESSLLSFNAALGRATARHGAHFKLLEASSEGGESKDVAASVIGTVIAQVEPWVDGDVAVVPRPTIENLTRDSSALRYPSGWTELEAGSIHPAIVS